MPCAKGAPMKSVHFIFTLLLFVVTTVLLALGAIAILIAPLFTKLFLHFTKRKSLFKHDKAPTLLP